MMSENRKIRVGITQGDTNGIGYEVILKTLSDPAMLEIMTPVIYGSSRVAAYHRKAMELPAVPLVSVDVAHGIRDGVNNIVEVIDGELKVEFGKASQEAGNAAFMALERAVQDLKNGTIDVLVTAPINKNSIQSASFTFPGHTEYLEASIGYGNKPLMILFNDLVRVALVTTHLPMSKVASTITKDAVLEKIRRFDHSLRYDFGIDCPRIAVLGLNPHCGDGGLLGNEEGEEIIPAIEQAEEEKIVCFGPYAADGYFGNGLYRHFDGTLAMYHDQGLAPFKTIAMESGVNFTAGLPHVRTSPDHGTGYDIAGKGEANADSMREAIYKAIDIYRNRQIEDAIHSNPLKRQYFNKSNDNVVLDLTKVEDEDLHA